MHSGTVPEFSPLALHPRLGPRHPANHRFHRCADMRRVRERSPCDNRPLLGTVNPESLETPWRQRRGVNHDSAGRRVAGNRPRNAQPGEFTTKIKFDNRKVSLRHRSHATIDLSVSTVPTIITLSSRIEALLQVPVELKAPVDCNSNRCVDIAAITNASCNWLLQYASRHRAGTGLAYTWGVNTVPIPRGRTDDVRHITRLTRRPLVFAFLPP